MRIVKAFREWRQGLHNKKVQAVIDNADAFEQERREARLKDMLNYATVRVDLVGASEFFVPSRGVTCTAYNLHKSGSLDLTLVHHDKPYDHFHKIYASGVWTQFEVLPEEPEFKVEGLG
jgi:hypothetical protein